MAKNVQLELFKETQIACMEMAYVVNSVFHHRKSFDTAAECKARINFRVDSAVFQNLRVDHSAAQIFDPACLFAYAAAFAFADSAFEIEFETRFDEREEGRSESYFDIFTENARNDLFQRENEVRNGDSLVNDKPFALMERVLVACVNRLVSVGFTRTYEFDRRLLCKHSADLNRGSLAAEKFSVFEPESVL